MKTQVLFDSIRPDITVIHNSRAIILELTCCYEKNFVASKSYKLHKYENATIFSKLDLPVDVYSLEVSSLGFVNDGSFKKFCKNILLPALPTTLNRILDEICLRCLYFIFCCRHKPWPAGVFDPTVTNI